MQNRIANEDVQHYFKAANVCVCPYRITLNSGVAHLYTLWNTGDWPKCWRIQRIAFKWRWLTFKQLDFEDLVSAMNKSLAIDFEKERKKS